MILVVNAGSSSIKFKLYKNDTTGPQALVEGLAERITVDGRLTIKDGNGKHEFEDQMDDHLMAVNSILQRFKELNVIENVEDIKGIGFRIVHGSEKIVAPVELTEENKAIIKEAIKLAPLHNPGALTAIEAFQQGIPNAKLVGCFDTSFHQTMPEENFLYSTPYKWYKENGVRKYGFHGISYEFITKKTAQILNKNIDDVNLIICHLGNGASMCCVKNGKSYDTTMGLTPLAGLIMGTRSGDIDPSIIQYMTKELSTDASKITDMLNKESGIMGLSEISSDMRDITDAIRDGNKQAQLALNLYGQRIAEYILKFANHLDGKIDALVFTAGVGENSVTAREYIVNKVKLLNLKFDDQANQAGYEDYLLISAQDSQYPMYKIRTDEELMICHETIKKL
ncbi:acetate kinase [Spiroplasma culicicola]|uniref:Acetate kinase n=1 Tax=Spiroplasma culicicola AES-1 TaxID=1276246 RepID=W6A8P4_9MOLU|nr:acetate kinase [Spiroplasma culicicola]AHI53260.1 acetate kinase [Spiroplasma culicicola AES-1]